TLSYFIRTALGIFHPVRLLGPDRQRTRRCIILDCSHRQTIPRIGTSISSSQAFQQIHEPSLSICPVSPQSRRPSLSAADDEALRLRRTWMLRCPSLPGRRDRRRFLFLRPLQRRVRRGNRARTRGLGLSQATPCHGRFRELCP